MKPRIVTIGVYGYQEEEFFRALVNADVDTFCDIRLRRGMRGSEYAFVNSRHLQDRLAELDIRYFHFKDLAPTQEIRAYQTAADRATGISKRSRVELSREFVEAYQKTCLATFDSQAFVAGLGEQAKVVALFCVEREPSACHRVLLAQKLVIDLKLDVNHIIP
jgi:uncharacterized protein (DUF488 family)